MKALTVPTAPQVLNPVQARKRHSLPHVLRSISATLRARSLAIMVTAGAITVIATFLGLEILASIAALLTVFTLRYQLQ